MAVLEWGSTDPASPGRLTRFLGGVGHDPRLPVALLALGAAAALASLLGEWLVVTVPNNGRQGNPLRVPAGVSEVGGFGTGYLVGLLALAGAVALAVGGTPAVRQNARVLGLGLAVALLALLVAATAALDDSTQRAYFASPDSGLRVEYGRGLVMAFVAVALCGVAIRLPGAVRRTPASAQPAADVVPDGSTGGATRHEAGAPALDKVGAVPRWGWRKWRRSPEYDDQPAAPEGLSVEPAAPFVRPDSPNAR